MFVVGGRDRGLGLLRKYTDTKDTYVWENVGVVSAWNGKTMGEGPGAFLCSFFKKSFHFISFHSPGIYIICMLTLWRMDLLTYWRVNR